MRSHTGSRLGLAVRRRSQSSEEAELQKWEHLVVPLDAAGGLKKGAPDVQPEHLEDSVRSAGRGRVFRSRRVTWSRGRSSSWSGPSG